MSGSIFITCQVHVLSQYNPIHIFTDINSSKPHSVFIPRKCMFPIFRTKLALKSGPSGTPTWDELSADHTGTLPVSTNGATQLAVPVKCSVHKPDFSQFGADLLNNCRLLCWQEQKEYVYILVIEDSSSTQQTKNDGLHYLFCNYGVEINLKIMFIHFSFLFFFLDFDSSTTVPRLRSRINMQHIHISFCKPYHR